MKLTISGNIAENIGGDFVRLDGDLSGSVVEISDNRLRNIGGHAVNAIDYGGLREKFPELRGCSDAELDEASRSVAGKTFDAAVASLQALGAFTTIASADWSLILSKLGWVAG